MEEKNIKNKKLFILPLAIVLIAFILIGFFIFKPKYELNKAIDYLKNGEYAEAYNYINTNSTKENQEIVMELITIIFSEKMTSGIENITTILNKSTSVLNTINKSNIDYSADDQVNIYVKKLYTYIDLKNKISKDMIVSELHNSYELYFSVLEFVDENFFDFLNNITDPEFINSIPTQSSNMLEIATDVNSLANNYSFNPKTQDIYEEISKYLK